MEPDRSKKVKTLKAGSTKILGPKVFRRTSNFNKSVVVNGILLHTEQFDSLLWVKSPIGWPKPSEMACFIPKQRWFYQNS